MDHPLKQLIKHSSINQRQLALRIKMSVQSFNLFLNGRFTPSNIEEILKAIKPVLIEHGVKEEDFHQAVNDKKEINNMSESVLRPETLRHFGLIKNPFSPARLRKGSDVYLSTEYNNSVKRIVSATRESELCIIVAGQGTGKSTAMDGAEEVLLKEKYIVVRFMLADHKNQRSVIGSIISAISTAVGVEYKGSDHQKSLDFIKETLLQYQDNRCMVLIDDGHMLSYQTLLSLKRKWDNLKRGFEHLVSIVILAQDKIYDLMKFPVMDEFSKHIDIHEMLGLLSADQIKDYIAKKVAGVERYIQISETEQKSGKAKWIDIFDVGVPDEIWKKHKEINPSLSSHYEHVIPRNLNSILIKLMNKACEDQADKVLTEHVQSN